MATNVAGVATKQLTAPRSSGFHAQAAGRPITAPTRNAMWNSTQTVQVSGWLGGLFPPAAKERKTDKTETAREQRKRGRQRRLRDVVGQGSLKGQVRRARRSPWPIRQAKLSKHAYDAGVRVIDEEPDQVVAHDKRRRDVRIEAGGRRVKRRRIRAAILEIIIRRVRATGAKQHAAHPGAEDANAGNINAVELHDGTIVGEILADRDRGVGKAIRQIEMQIRGVEACRATVYRYFQRDDRWRDALRNSAQDER